MASSTKSTSGSVDDTVRLEVGAVGRVTQITYVEDYEYTLGIFDQPCIFRAKVGSADEYLTLKSTYERGTPFRLFVNNVLQFDGLIDAHTVKANAHASSFAIRGRDLMQRLFQGVPAEKTYQNESSLQIMRIALDACGLDLYDIATDFSGRTRAGVPVLTQTSPSQATFPKSKERKTKIGETWLEFVKRDFRHSGVFPMYSPATAATLGSSIGLFVVTAPNTSQDPLYRLERSVNRVDMLDTDFSDDTVPRFTEARFYGHGGGGKHGLSKTRGSAFDDEMIGLGYDRIHTAVDRGVTSDEEAEFYASRVIADSRRRGRKHVYTVSGHSAPVLGGLSDTYRAIWTPDTMVQVSDNLLGLYGNYYLESVTGRGSSRGTTTTELTLLRDSDCLFGPSASGE